MANRAFIRFKNITIPKYSEVSNVFARFTAYSNRSDAPVNLRCAFVNEDNPDAPASYAELQAFSLTEWVSWSSLTAWTNGQEYDTSDLTVILQSIINRDSWSSGNNVILIIEDISSSGQRGFSSVQFDSGNEKTTLFVTYIAREANYISNVDDDFTGENNSIPNPNLWYRIANANSTTPLIQNDQLYGAPSGEGILYYANLISAWYSNVPMDVQIDWDARLFADTGLSEIEFAILYDTDIYRQTSMGYSTLANIKYRGAMDDFYGIPYESRMQANIYGDSKEEIPWSGNNFGTWRMSISAVGGRYRVVFYIDGVIWHDVTSDSIVGNQVLSIFLKSTYQPYPSVVSSPGIFDNFVFNTGSPIAKLAPL